MWVQSIILHLNSVSQITNPNHMYFLANHALLTFLTTTTYIQIRVDYIFLAKEDDAVFIPYLHNIPRDSLECRIHGPAVDKNLTSQRLTIDAPRQSVQERSLGGARRARNGQHFTRSCISRHIVEQNFLLRLSFSVCGYNLQLTYTSLCMNRKSSDNHYWSLLWNHKRIPTMMVTEA